VSDLRDILFARTKGHIFFPDWREDIAREAAEEAAEPWNGWLRPSRVKTPYCCPHTLIREIAGKQNVSDEASQREPFSVKTKIIMDIGTAFHRAVQQRMRERMAHKLYGRPNITDPELLKELEEIWPENPGRDDVLGWTYHVDSVLKCQGEPVIIDWKSTTKDKKDWIKDITPPPINYRTQLKIYKYFINKHNYYDKPVRRVALLYFNLSMKGEVVGEHEWSETPSLEDDLLIEEMVKHLSAHRTAFLAGADLPCTYSACPTHAELNLL
jgi:hypothetical protein